MSRHLIVSLHDLHPGSFTPVEEQRLELAELGVTTCSLLVVPEFHHGLAAHADAKLNQWLQRRTHAGDEVVLHGYYHDRVGLTDNWQGWWWTRFYTNREAEFFDLTQEQAFQRLQRGLDAFAACGWKVDGFIAPGWLLSSGSRDALVQAALRYTTTVNGIELFQTNNQRAFVPARSLCWSTRAAWRRTCSLAWNETLFRLLSSGPVLRVALHPMDFQFVAVRQQILRLIRQALKLGFEPVTYSYYAASRPAPAQ